VGRAVVAAAVVALLALAAGVGYVRQRLQPSPTPPLEPGWAATVAVLAGDGVQGTVDGPGTRARFSEPFGIAAAPDGTLYVADAGHADLIRRISPDGQVSTLAGGFRTPSGVALASDGTLYVADTGHHAIRRVMPDGQVTTLAGDGTPGYADGPGAQARFNGPIGVAVAPDGRVLVADTYNDRIRVVDSAGNVTTLAGSGQPDIGDGVGAGASFDTPSGIAVDARGLDYLADTGNGVVRTVDANGVVTTPAWSAGDGFSRPLAVAVSPEGDLYVADEAGRIVAIAADGRIRVLAGAGAGFHDGPGSIARFRRPSGVALRAPGHLVVADAGNALVRSVAATSQRALQPPTSPAIHPSFDAATFDAVPLLWPVVPFSGPHEIAGTFGEIRGTRRERFHVGIDVRVEQGHNVYAVRDGVVLSPVSNNGLNSLDEWLRVGNVTYVHIRAGRTRTALLDASRFTATYEGKKLTRLRVKRGARYAAGELIGTVNRFNHVHMNVGWPGEEHNPLRFRLVNFEDTVPPAIPGDGIRVYDEAWRQQSERVDGRLRLAGRVRVTIEAWDQADDNTPSRRLAPYEVGYQLLHGDGSPVTGFEKRQASLRFDRVEPDPEAPHRVYGEGSGIPFYNGGRARYLYIATNRLDGGQTAEGFLDTRDLPPGPYVLRGWVADTSGNLTERDLPVVVGG
jgi:hypothetical protein